jgi:hypothetical protein
MTLSSILFYAMAIAVSFASTFLHGLQSINTSGGHKSMAALTGYLMYVVDASIIGIIGKGGVEVAFISSLGAGAGYYVSIIFHSWLTKAQRKAEKERQKLKMLKRIRKEIKAYYRMPEDEEEPESSSVTT